MENVERTLERLEKAVPLGPILDLNPPLRAHVRSATFPHYDNAYGKTVWCVGTGKDLPYAEVKCAHIIKKQWHAFAPRIGVRNIHDTYNVIPLHQAIELILDSGELLINYEAADQEYHMYLLNGAISNVQLDL